MDDLISRQAAIDALCKRCDLVNDDTCGEKCIDIKIIEKLPSVNTFNLVDKKAACEAVKNEMLSWLDGDNADYRNVQDAIMDIPKFRLSEYIKYH